MPNTPSTFRAEPAADDAPWNDAATLHRRDDEGLLSDFRAIRRGTLAAMIRHVQSLPPAERGHYVIDKAGDHRLSAHEIEVLANRPDFPQQGA